MPWLIINNDNTAKVYFLTLGSFISVVMGSKLAPACSFVNFISKLPLLLTLAWTMDVLMNSAVSEPIERRSLSWFP